MSRSGCARLGKALSSGRLTGAAEVTNGQNQFSLRRGCNCDAESAYSVCSTESDSQVDTVHNGLDRCATLLNDILQNEATGRETVHKKTEKTTSVKTVSKPLLTKGTTSKKKELQEVFTPAHIQKEIVPTSDRKLASSIASSAQKELPLAAHSQMVQLIHAPCSQHSPVMHQKLCKHVQTQTSPITGQTSQNSNEIPALTPLPTSSQGCQTVTAFNYRLPTSASAVPLQHSANPSSAQSDAPEESGNVCVPEVGGPVACPIVSAVPTAQIQSATALPNVLCCVASSALSNSAVPTFTPSSGREITSNHEQQIKEADLVRCMQAHLATLQSHEMMNGRTEQKCHHCPAKHASSEKEEDTSEDREDVVSEENESSVADIAPVRDRSCKTTFAKKVLKSRKESPEETAHKVKTLKYLLGELRALITDEGDLEMLRLMSEIEDCISLLPAVTKSTNTQTEIALALQPLRSENCQLQRKVRILNQQLKQERREKTSGQSFSYELVSLQSLNVMLQSQLEESLKGLESLQAKNEELLKIIENQQEENKRLAKVIQDKEEELLENKRHYDIHSTKLKIEVEEALANGKSLQLNLETSEKENKILGITLRQRDAEANRLRELTRNWTGLRRTQKICLQDTQQALLMGMSSPFFNGTQILSRLNPDTSYGTLQGTVAKLLSDLTADIIRPKPEKGLSKSLLEDHEKQMQPDPFPGSTSVMTYFKKLEMDHISTDTELRFANKSGQLETRNLAYENLTTEGSKINNTFSKEAPRILLPSLEQDAEAVSDSGTLLGDRSKLDETVYIPFSSSASKNKQPISERTGVLPQSRQACKMLDYHCELSNSMQQNVCDMLMDPTNLDKVSAGYSVKKTMEATLEVPSDKVDLEAVKVCMRPKGTPSGAAKDFTHKSDQPQPGTYPHVPLLPQKKGSEIAVFSSISCDDVSGRSEWSASSYSTFISQDAEDFKYSLSALDANITRLQSTLQTALQSNGYEEPKWNTLGLVRRVF